MYDTSGSYSMCHAAPPDYDLARRLSWLECEVARQEAGAIQRRAPVGQRSLRSIQLGPTLTTGEAYAWFGTFLGLFPPFAIFMRIFGGALTDGLARRTPTPDGFLFWVLLFLAMNAVCCLVGRKIGACLGRNFGDPRAWRWSVFIFSSLVMAIAWGVVTGAAGGAVAFLVGAFCGVACAVPVALAAFPVFAVLQRLLSHGGIIEERRLWPLAFGVPLTVAAMILSPWLE